MNTDNFIIRDMALEVNITKINTAKIFGKKIRSLSNPHYEISEIAHASYAYLNSALYSNITHSWSHVEASFMGGCVVQDYGCSVASLLNKNIVKINCII